MCAAIIFGEIVIFGVLIWFYASGTIIVFEKPADLASIMLTAAGVLMTGVAVLVALLAYFGFTEIKDRAVTEAILEAKEVAKKAAQEAAEPVATRVAEVVAKEYLETRESGKSNLQALLQALTKNADDQEPEGNGR